MKKYTRAMNSQLPHTFSLMVLVALSAISVFLLNIAVRYSRYDTNPQIKAQVGVETAASTPQFGVSTHLTWWASGYNWRTEVDRLAASGIKVVRFDLSWKWTQRNGRGTYDTAFINNYTTMLDYIFSKNMQPIVEVIETPDWANNSRGSFYPPNNMEDYGTFMGYLAQATANKPHMIYEVWNEPDISKFWTSGPNASSYTSMLRSAYNHIKAVDPDTMVLGGVLSWGNTRFLDQMYTAGAGAYFDHLSFHDYASDPAAAQSSITDIRSKMVQYGDTNKNIYITEFGWQVGGSGGHSVPDDATRARYLAQTVQYINAFSYVKAAAVYTTAPNAVNEPTWLLWAPVTNPNWSTATTLSWDEYVRTINSLMTPSPTAYPSPTPTPVQPTTTPVPPTPTPVPPTPTLPPVNTPTSQPTAVPTSPPAASRITIYAAGSQAAGVYPTMQLIINNTVVQTYTGITGNYNTRTFNAYTYNSPVRAAASQIKVAFTNDASINGSDRNLYVDRINIDGVDYQTELSTTLSTGSWTSATGCSPGYKQLEILACNGYFWYNHPSATTSLTPAEDSYINSAYPNDNYGTQSKLYVYTSPVQVPYLKFNLSALAGKTLVSATLQVTTTGDSYAGSAAAQNIKLVSTNSWSEATLNYNNRQALSTTLGSIQANTIPARTYSTVLNPSVLQPILGQTVSLAITGTSSDGFVINSRHVTAGRPTLILTYN